MCSSDLRYLRTARDFGLLVTGGSDYHGDSAHRKGGPGSTSLPPEHWDALRSRQRAG